MDPEAKLNRLLTEELVKEMDKAFYLIRCEHGKYKWDIERLKNNRKDLEEFLKGGFFYAMKTYPNEICEKCRDNKIYNILK